jgi:hypothetical protein
MARRVHVTPGSLTSLQAKVSIVVVGLFLLFGLVFGFVVLQDTSDSESGLRLLIGAFFLIWVVVCLSMIVFFARLASKQKNPQDNSLVDISFEETRDISTTASGDFESRLRKLAQLKEDGLITEEEYRGKRAQILNDKW